MKKETVGVLGGVGGGYNWRCERSLNFARGEERKEESYELLREEQERGRRGSAL